MKDLLQECNILIENSKPKISEKLRLLKRTFEKCLNWINWVLKRLYRYLSVYENREKVRRQFCWVLILVIVIVPFFIHQTEFPTGRHVGSTIDSIPTIPLMVEDLEVTSERILDTCFNCIKYNLNDRYTIYKVVKRTNAVRITLISNDWYTYSDIQNIGKYMKSAYPDLDFTIIYVRSYDTTHTVVDYRI